MQTFHRPVSAEIIFFQLDRLEYFHVMWNFPPDMAPESNWLRIHIKLLFLFIQIVIQKIITKLDLQKIGI